MTTQHAQSHAHPHADQHDEKADNIRIQRLAWFLEAHFGEVELHMPDESNGMDDGHNHESEGPSLVVRLDEDHATIDLVSMASTNCYPDVDVD